MVKNDNIYCYKVIELFNRYYLIIFSGIFIENFIDEIWV